MFVYTVPRGTFSAFTQALANAYASDHACEQATIHQVCLTGIIGQTCANVPFNQVISATGLGVTDVMDWVISGNFPTGISQPEGLLGSSITLSGVPTAPGTYNFSVTATSSEGDSMTRNYSLLVAGITNSGTLPAGVAGTAYNFTLMASGITAPSFSISAGALPAGLSMDSNGNITGTHLAAGAGTTNLVFDVQDLANPSFVCASPGSITITVPPINFNLINWGTSPQLSNGVAPPQSASNVGNTCIGNLTAVPVQANNVAWTFTGTLTYTGPAVVCSITFTGSLPQTICSGFPISSLSLQIVYQPTATTILNIPNAQPGNTYTFTVPQSVNAVITIGNFVFGINQRCTPTSANINLKLLPAYN